MSSLTMLSAQLVPRGKKEVAFPMGAPYRHRTTVFWSRSLPAEQIIVPVHREETARAMPVFEILVVPERRLQSTSAFCFSRNLQREGFHFRGASRVQVIVRDNNIEQALRVLKKRMQREGVFREMRRRRFYEKPSERATREKAEAVRRSRKLARKQAIREGLIAAPPRKPPLGGKRGDASRVNAAATPQR